MAIRIITDIPAAEVDDLAKLFKIAGATEVRKVQEEDGQTTLIVRYPEHQSYADLASARG